MKLDNVSAARVSEDREFNTVEDVSAARVSEDREFYTVEDVSAAQVSEDREFYTVDAFILKAFNDNDSFTAGLTRKCLSDYWIGW